MPKRHLPSYARVTASLPHWAQTTSLIREEETSSSNTAWQAWQRNFSIGKRKHLDPVP